MGVTAVMGAAMARIGLSCPRSRMVHSVDEARALIRRFWTGRLFDPEPQQAMLATFGSYLTPEDHVRRMYERAYTRPPTARREEQGLGDTGPQ